MCALVLRAGLVLPMTPDNRVFVDGAVVVGETGQTRIVRAARRVAGENPAPQDEARRLLGGSTQ